jgi:hypothetical protein
VLPKKIRFAIRTRRHIKRRMRANASAEV